MALICAQDVSSSPFPSCPSSSNNRWSYDVFLSFRGEDTRKNFTDHLYAALRQRRIVVFRDDPNLERGKAIAPELLKAIEESRISMIILSRDYASSTWCLDELLKIVRCMNSTGQLVLPIFYDVDPSEVRKQTGKYQEAFDKHEETFRNNIEKVHNWRNAMVEVANLPGWDRKDQHESKFIQDIVEMVSNKLSPTLSYSVEDLVGMDSRMLVLNSYMAVGSNDVRIVGICGMGGVGKTTIARVYYDRMSCKFEGSTFLANVREVSSKGDLCLLQKQLLCETLMVKNVNIWNVFQGSQQIKSRLHRKRVLIIIDDADQLNQLKELAGKVDWFGPGSRIIITTRDEHLLAQHEVQRIYRVEELNHNEALQLFSSKAFKNEHPPEDYMKLSTNILKYANGLPLALKVLGSSLFGKTVNEWRSVLARMKENPKREILVTLQISFEGLEETEKKIFLDIACFFKGKDRDDITKILDSCVFYPEIGIRVLIDKCLITILDKNKLWMHDLIQEMGWKLVREESPNEPGRRSRLWLYKDVYHVFKKNTGTEDVEGIVLDLPAQGEAELSVPFLSKMSNLRLLIFQNVHFSHGVELEYLSNVLRILKWHEYPSKSLPSSFHPEQLIELDLCYSKVEQLWKGVKNFNNLKIINLSHSENLVKTPDFRGVPNLEELILEGCTNLYRVDETIGILESLISVNLKDCKNLATLPNCIYGLKALTVINLSGCSKLEYMLEEFGQAESLAKLDISGTAIRQSPSAFCHFKMLIRLSLSGHKGQLQRSWVSGLSFFPRKDPNSMNFLLQSLSSLCFLQGLDLSNCNLAEESFPDNLSCVSSLKGLNLSGNNFSTLPESIRRLSMLQFLYLDDCKRLQSLPELPSNLSLLTARACPSLETFPGVLQLCNLQSPELKSANCLMLVENQEHSMIQFLMSRQYILYFAKSLLSSLPDTPSECYVTLLDLFNRGATMDVVVCGTKIPKWFNHQNLGDSISIQLPPVWHDSKWLGFALCAVFSVNPDLASFNKLTVHLRCSVVIMSPVPQKIEGFCFHAHLHENCYLIPVDRLWLFYLPRYGFFDTDWPNTPQATHHIVVKITGLDGCFEVKKCGIHLVCEEDGLDVENEVREFCRSNPENFNVFPQDLAEFAEDNDILIMRSLSQARQLWGSNSENSNVFPQNLDELVRNGTLI